MITLKQPALALNSFDVPGYEYSMWTTWKMPRNATPRDVVYWIQYACDTAPEKMLKHVILNAHGLDGKIFIGKDNKGADVTINNYNVGIFSELRTKSIGTIWIISCLVAQSGIGKYLCETMAKAAGCNVVAAEAVQTGWWTPFGVLFMPKGNIDDYEGKVHRWDARGNRESFYPNGGNY